MRGGQRPQLLCPSLLYGVRICRLNHVPQGPSDLRARLPQATMSQPSQSPGLSVPPPDGPSSSRLPFPEAFPNTAAAVTALHTSYPASQCCHRPPGALGANPPTPVQGRTPHASAEAPGAPHAPEASTRRATQSGTRGRRRCAGSTLPSACRCTPCRSSSRSTASKPDPATPAQYRSLRSAACEEAASKGSGPGLRCEARRRSKLAAARDPCTSKQRRRTARSRRLDMPTYATPRGQDFAVRMGWKEP